MTGVVVGSVPVGVVMPDLSDELRNYILKKRLELDRAEDSGALSTKYASFFDETKAKLYVTYKNFGNSFAKLTAAQKCLKLHQGIYRGFDCYFSVAQLSALLESNSNLRRLAEILFSPEEILSLEDKLQKAKHLPEYQDAAIVAIEECGRFSISGRRPETLSYSSWAAGH